MDEIHADHDSDKCGQLMLASDVWWWSQRTRETNDGGDDEK